MYTLCMRGGPKDGEQVEWTHVPDTFKFPTFTDRQDWLTQYNTFPTVPCHVYARDSRHTCACTTGISHYVFTYGGEDIGDRLIT